MPCTRTHIDSLTQEKKNKTKSKTNETRILRRNFLNGFYIVTHEQQNWFAHSVGQIGTAKVPDVSQSHAFTFACEIIVIIRAVNIFSFFFFLLNSL